MLHDELSCSYSFKSEVEWPSIFCQEQFCKSCDEKSFCNDVYQDVLPLMFVNTDETAIYFETQPKCTLHPTGAGSLSVRCWGSNNRRLTVCVSVGSDGSKVLLFLIFKAQLNSRVAKRWHEYMPDNVYVCCKQNGLMDQQYMKIWLENVWRPKTSHFSLLIILLDYFISQEFSKKTLGRFWYKFWAASRRI